MVYFFLLSFLGVLLVCSFSFLFFVFFGEHGAQEVRSPIVMAGFCAARGLRSGSPVGDGT